MIMTLKILSYIINVYEFSIVILNRIMYHESIFHDGSCSSSNNLIANLCKLLDTDSQS